MKKDKFKPTMELRRVRTWNPEALKLGLHVEIETLQQKFVATQFKRTETEVLEIEHEEWRNVPLVVET